MYKKVKGQPYYTNRHSCFMLAYHIVLVTKFRKPVLQGKVKESVYTTIRNILEERECMVLELNGEADHVHILFEAGPDIAPMELINIMKTKTARFARRDYPANIKQYYQERFFWADSYFVTTVGNNAEDLVSEYMKNQ